MNNKGVGNNEIIRNNEVIKNDEAVMNYVEPKMEIIGFGYVNILTTSTLNIIGSGDDGEIKFGDFK